MDFPSLFSFIAWPVNGSIHLPGISVIRLGKAPVLAWMTIAISKALVAMMDASDFVLLVADCEKKGSRATSSIPLMVVGSSKRFSVASIFTAIASWSCGVLLSSGFNDPQ